MNMERAADKALRRLDADDACRWRVMVCRTGAREGDALVADVAARGCLAEIIGLIPPLSATT